MRLAKEATHRRQQSVEGLAAVASVWTEALNANSTVNALTGVVVPRITLDAFQQWIAVAALGQRPQVRVSLRALQLPPAPLLQLHAAQEPAVALDALLLAVAQLARAGLVEEPGQQGGVEVLVEVPDGVDVLEVFVGQASVGEPGVARSGHRRPKLPLRLGDVIHVLMRHHNTNKDNEIQRHHWEVQAGDGAEPLFIDVCKEALFGDSVLKLSAHRCAEDCFVFFGVFKHRPLTAEPGALLTANPGALMALMTPRRACEIRQVSSCALSSGWRGCVCHALTLLNIEAFELRWQCTR
mmetsp:Transcript_29844/g.85419  ORF Transcript_29844/g.85419 Transcript_29844/m.85419 type:complete len:296 (+) Transcript_29844:1886-2773(+)